MKHELKRFETGEGDFISVIPKCSCGWSGRAEHAYNDYFYTNLKEQEAEHMKMADEAMKESKP